MTKRELMRALDAIVHEKQYACETRLQSLPKDSNTERKALLMQKNLYGIAKTAVAFAGEGEEFPRPFIGQTTNLLKEEDGLRVILQNAEGEEQRVLAVYFHNMLFLRQNFLRRYQQEALTATDPHRQFEARIKCATMKDLMSAYKSAFEKMGGRKDLVI